MKIFTFKVRKPFENYLPSRVSAFFFEQIDASEVSRVGGIKKFRVNAWTNLRDVSRPKRSFMQLIRR